MGKGKGSWTDGAEFLLLFSFSWMPKSDVSIWMMMMTTAAATTTTNAMRMRVAEKQRRRSRKVVQSGASVGGALLTEPMMAFAKSKTETLSKLGARVSE